MSIPLVTICLPNLNTRPFLQERMETILAQTFSDWEMVVSDNYSDDSSWEFLQKFGGDPRIRLFQSPRKGMYANWNTCIENARGQYLYIATSDDTSKPEMIERLLSPLVRFPRTRIAVCDYQAIDKDSKPIEKMDASRAFLGEWMTIPSIRSGITEFLLHACFRTTWITMTSVLFHRDILARAGLFRTDVGSLADIEWSMRASLASDIAFVPGKLATWRVHDRQATQLHPVPTVMRTLLDGLESILRDPASGIPDSWKSVPDWDARIARIFHSEYHDSFQLYRGTAKTEPVVFLKNFWTALRMDLPFLLRQAGRGFSWSDEFAVDGVSEAHQLIALFKTPWPPTPIPDA